MDISKIFKQIGKTAKKHSPEILTGLGVAGMISAVVTAVTATPKALELIEKKKEQLQAEKLTVKETVKAAWKYYIPTATMCTVSAVCIICANSVSSKRNAALATAYKLSETALKEYRDKVVEVIGEKKEQTVRDSIAKDKIDRDPVSAKEIVITNCGEALCYDVLSGRYFRSDIEKIKKAVNELNKRMMSENYISLNEFYYEIGLNDIELGNMLGWDIVKDGFIDLNFSSQLADDGTPCLVIGHFNAPKYDI